MDKEQRSRIQKATQEVRRLLETEFATQLLQTFDIDVERARWADQPGAHLSPEQRLVRRQLVAWIEHREVQIGNRREALLLALREMAFTTLNRFVALKLMEARQLVRPCVSGGLESAGFQEFTAIAEGLLVDREAAYRLFLETIFEDVSREVRVLFDPRDPASLLWPRRAALQELLEILNRPELAPLWSEDETLGWVYQYFNGDAERKKMREESAAPRNSRELAVRNQFFTPRYVVEFLTDNTLGRIWYEMRQGNTTLRDRCRYLVRRPNEIFLAPGEAAPAEAVAADDPDLTQEELLRQPVYIPHRPLKDPREIRLLDPACGSMHFGLYAFDLFQVIYEEAWDLAHSGEIDRDTSPEFASFVTDVAAFADRTAFLRQVPQLIVEHNIHGIDIDPRAAQIAGLSLWLRAQRGWQTLGTAIAERPSIRRSNVVCAEPMPGEKELLREFVEQQFPLAEQPAFTFLLETVFDHMTLAGDAGSLLRIEEEIRSAIAEAKRLWKQGPQYEQPTLFTEFAPPREQGSLRLDLSGITDEQFWEQAEQRIYAALEAYAEQAQNGTGFRRRLFTQDAAQGFAFIDVCRNQYDAVVMNPPFGTFCRTTKAYAAEQFPHSANDIFAAFIELFLQKLVDTGLLGAITSRTGFFIASFSDWRREVIRKNCRLICFGDLGIGVMDNATVEAAAYVLGRQKSNVENNPASLFIRLLAQKNKESDLFRAVNSVCKGHDQRQLVFWSESKQFDLLPDAPFVYWARHSVLRTLANWPSFEPSAAQVRKGLRTGDNFRFVRALWEIPQQEFTPAISATSSLVEREASMWVPLVLSGTSQPWFSPLLVALNWRRNGRELRQYVTKYGSPSRLIQAENFYFKPGISWTRRAVRFVPYAIPSGCIPTGSRPMAFPNDGLTLNALAVSASRVASTFMRFYGDWFSRPNFLEGKVKLFPWPELSQELSRQLDALVRHESESRRLAYRAHEPFFDFVQPFGLVSNAENGSIGIDWSTLLGPELEAAVETAYGLSQSTAAGIHQDLNESLNFRESSANLDGEEDEEDASETLLDYSERSRFAALISYALGCAFGRWDVRYATGDKSAPKLPDPFAPLPICPPGQLQNIQGLPARPEDVPAAYPIRIPWDGILVDDPNHPLDLDYYVQGVIKIIWRSKEGTSAQTIDQEACSILGVSSFREYYRKSSGFFADHLNRYTKSHRQAPIYWQLSVGSISYSIWLYYHRFTSDTLYRVLRDFVEPRIQQVERETYEFESQGAISGDAAVRLHETQTLLQDLRILKGELDLVAPLWNPNLNDGVIINHAILWRITPYTPWQKKCKECWDKLVKGDYDWAHLAFHLWPERVIPKCTTDRSLAIAHGLEDRLWQELPNGKWEPRPLDEADLQALIAERANPAISSALERLLAAPPPVAPTRTRAPRAGRAASAGSTRRPRTATADTDPETARQLLLVLTAAPAEGLSKSAIADLLGVEANSLTTVIRQLKDSGQIEQQGERRGARYRLTDQGRAAIDTTDGGDL